MALSQSEAKERVEKRAQYENFKMVVCRNGFVNVCNQSHNDDSAHTYSVEVRGGEARSCSCPHHVHRNKRCKHMTAVENRPIVVASANAASGTYESDGTDDDESGRFAYNPYKENEEEVDDTPL